VHASGPFLRSRGPGAFDGGSMGTGPPGGPRPFTPVAAAGRGGGRRRPPHAVFHVSGRRVDAPSKPPRCPVPGRGSSDRNGLRRVRPRQALNRGGGSMGPFRCPDPPSPTFRTEREGLPRSAPPILSERPWPRGYAANRADSRRPPRRPWRRFGEAVPSPSREGEARAPPRSRPLTSASRSASRRGASASPRDDGHRWTP